MKILLPKSLREILHYRDLWWMLTLRDIRIRYKQAIMGFLWALFMPIVAIFAGILIKKAMAFMAGQAMDEKAIVAMTFKVLPWTFFASSIRFAVQSLVGNSSLITKIYFPRAVLPLSAVSACFFDFLIAALILPVLIVIFRAPVNLYYLYLPYLILLVVLFTLGVGLLLSAANLFYRDVKYIVEIILMFGIFFTPVFYDANSLGKFGTIMRLNPIGSILESINQVISFNQPPDSGWLSYASVCSLGMFLLGFYFFHKFEPAFAENI